MSKTIKRAGTVLRRFLRRLNPNGETYPRGHFYSPLPDLGEVRAKAHELFRTNVELRDGVELRSDAQITLLKELSAKSKDLTFPTHSATENRYYSQNSFFQEGSAAITSAMLLHLHPKQIIEVGSGFSSAMMLDVNDQFWDSEARFTFIEPYPDRLRSLTKSGDLDRHQLIQMPVQEVPLSIFDQLQANDVLFIDSSHVAKVGSDLNHLMFNVLPRLQPGVVIHFHDIYWPFEYPQAWIVDEKRAWNEAYLLRAFLQFNRAFEIALYVQYLRQVEADWFQELWPNVWQDPGSALWVRRTL